MKVLSKLNSLDNVNDGDTRKLITKTSESGTGNVVSSISVSGDTISYTKNVNALTSHQKTFSTVKVGSTNVVADKAGDTLELVAGSNITLTPDTTNDKVTIAATDTTYENKTAASEGTEVSLVTTGEKYIWNNKGSGTITGVSVNGTSVATSGVANITTAPASILFGDIPSAVTATTQNPGDNSTKIATTAYVDRAISSPFVTKTYTDIIGVTNNTDANCAFFFGSVRPNSFTDIWAVKYRIYVWCENNNNYKAVADCFFEGSQSNVASYAVFNNIYNTSYRPVYYHSMYRLTQAGYDANYGHALGFSLRDSTERLNTSLKRTVQVELLEYKNCTVTFNDEAVKWADWAGGNSTNYGSIQSYNFSANGLQETGDANDNSIAWHIRSYYERTKVGPNKLFQYNLCTYTSGDKLEGFVNSASIETTKTKNTTTFRLGAPIYYYNSATNLVENKVAADNTLNSQNANVDLRYSTNCAKTLTTNLPVYLVGIPNKANFTLDDTWYTQTLPSTEDGKIYILLGIAYSSYQIAFNLQHPIYWYKDGVIQLYQMPISSNDVTTALGYTPYNSTNPNGYTSNTGTITKVQANGTDVASSGTANIPAASTSAYGVTKLSNATDSTSEVLAATPKAVKAAYDLAAGKGTGTITGVSVNGTSVATSGVANITATTGVKGDSESSYRTGNVNITKANIGLGNVENKSSATIRGELTSSNVTTALGYTPINSNLKGTNNGLAELDANGKVPSAQLPSYVDDVLEYTSQSAFPTTGETGKIYIAQDTNKTYRWSGTAYTEISASLALGETSSTAYRGDRGKIAYDHSQSTHARTDATATAASTINGNIKINGAETTVYNHPNSGVSAGTYKSVTVNATGHITAGSNPTTLSGYGITDAKIENGTITLGSNTITPLTSYTEINSNLVNGSATGSLRTISSTEESANYTIGQNALAHGINTKASGEGSHSEGYFSTASGQYSHAEGSSCSSSGLGSHAEGAFAYANGDSSHAEGYHVIASTPFQHVQGKYNVADLNDTYAHIVGGGTSNTQKNIHTLTWTGEAWYQGDVYVGSTSGTNKDAGSKKLLKEGDVTDTKNTAGSTDTSNKIFLIGATSQAANPQTYSDNEVYATDGVLQAKEYSINNGAKIVYNSIDKTIEFKFI